MKPVTIKGTRNGFRSASVVVCDDGSMYRGDVQLDLATRIRSLTEAAKVVGMTRAEFIAERNKLRAA